MCQGQIASDVAWMLEAYTGVVGASAAGPTTVSCAALVLLLASAGESESSVAACKAMATSLSAPPGSHRNGLQSLLQWLLLPAHAESVVKGLCSDCPSTPKALRALNSQGGLAKSVAWLVRRLLPGHSPAAVTVTQHLCMTSLRSAYAYVTCAS